MHLNRETSNLAPTVNQIAVLIVNYRSTVLVNQLLHGLSERYGSQCHVYVADNSGDFELRADIGAKLPIKIITTGGNIGFGKACNALVAQSREPFLLFLNPDVALLDEPLTSLIRSYAELLSLEPSSPGFVLGISLVDDYDAPQPSFGNFPSIPADLADVLRLPSARRVRSAPTCVSGLRSVDYVSGAFMLMSRALFERAGGFDPRFFLYFEETDLQKRIRSFGGTVYTLTTVRAIHRNGGTHVSSMMRDRHIYEGKKVYIRLHYRGLARLAMLGLNEIRFAKRRLRHAWDRDRSRNAIASS